MAGGRAARRPLHSAQAVDVASVSSFRAFEILHLHLDLRVEFGPPGPGPGSRALSGTATYQLRCLLPEGASELRLDSHPCLEVTAAVLQRERPGSEEEPPAEPVSFHTQPFSHYGQALCVVFPQPCRTSERLQLRLTFRVGEGPGVSASCLYAAWLSGHVPQPWPRAPILSSVLFCTLGLPAGSSRGTWGPGSCQGCWPSALRGPGVEGLAPGPAPWSGLCFLLLTAAQAG